MPSHLAPQSLPIVRQRVAMQPEVTSHQKGDLSARPVALTPLSKSNLHRLDAGPKAVRSYAQASSQLLRLQTSLTRT